MTEYHIFKRLPGFLYNGLLVLGTVHILRHLPRARGREGVLEKMTKDDGGGGWS